MLYSIPDKAKGFADEDVKDDTVALVEFDKNDQIVKVTIPGTADISLKLVTPVVSPGRSNPSRQSQTRHPANALKGKVKASPKILGEPFHNPYTFIPFAADPVRGRKPATLITIDETRDGCDRKTGIVDLTITTVSPLLSCTPIPTHETKGGHKTYQTLTIGDDVIVPASWIRGSLRTQLTILTRGTLGYVDKSAFLIQGRDTKIGPRPKDSTTRMP